MSELSHIIDGAGMRGDVIGYAFAIYGKTLFLIRYAQDLLAFET